MSTSLLLASACAAGIAAGVFLDPATIAPAHWAVAFFALVSFVAAARGWLGLARWCVTLGFVPVCTVIGSAAEERAMHPPLRQFLEDRIGGFAMETVNLERHDTPLEIEGRLTTDAYATDAGAALRVRVGRVSAGACLEPTEGGVSITVLGSMAAG